MKNSDIIYELISAVSHNAEELHGRLVEGRPTVRTLARADVYELSELLSDPNLAAYIAVASALASRRVTDSFKLGKKHTDEEIEAYLRALFVNEAREVVYLLSLDREGRVTHSDRVGDGTVNRLGIVPRRLLEIASRRGAAAVIIAHNHPGGAPEPSGEDIATSAAIKNSLDTAGIKLLCNYVVSDEEIRSFLSASEK